MKTLTDVHMPYEAASLTLRITPTVHAELRTYAESVGARRIVDGLTLLLERAGKAGNEDPTRVRRRPKSRPAAAR